SICYNSSWCLVFVFVIFFFFSSRRRHTRFSRDWSSDVCSSDLRQFAERGGGFAGLRGAALGELAAEAGVLGGVEQGVDLGLGETGAHVRIVSQGLAERPRLRDGGLRRLVDGIVGALPSDLLAELEHERL